MSSLAPLESTRFCILLALARRPLHGYAIAEQIDRDAGSLVRLDYSTVYKSLKRLEEDGLIKRAAKSTRQVTFALTPKGKRALLLEKDRLEKAVGLVRERFER
ncbi:MAG: PadR family transcriptional regulator [Candidatus Saccharibacteria bacterium]|jgi:DNA-binding PadR family transcriptional regulator|nr:PadR family transcriptional regulator [Candidatus Saccharibacteria bacterium]